MKTSICCIGAAITFIAGSGAGFAQTVSPSPEQSFSIGVLGGVVAGEMHSGANVGATVAIEAARWFTIEGRGVYLREGRGVSGLEASVTALFTPVRTMRVAPFLGFGGGLYRATFNLDNAAMFGGRNETRMRRVETDPSGMNSNRSTWIGLPSDTAFAVDAIPMFYAGRIESMMIGGNGRWAPQSFTDPALSLAAGVRLDVSPRFYLRPDVRTLLVFGNGDTMMVTSAGIGVGVRLGAK